MDKNARMLVGVMTAIVWIGLSPLASVACSPVTEPGMPSDAGPKTPLPLDVPLAADAVRCGPVTRDSETIGGIGAYGQVGRSFRCYNNRIRFLIQDDSRPVGLSSYGGNLIDIDLVRESELDEGFDTFRELAVGFGVNEVRVSSIEVLRDGTEGGEGIIRVRGEPAPMSMAPQASYLRQELPAEVITDYILRPGLNYVEIKTTLVNQSDDYILNVLYADFLVMGKAAALHTPEYGFATPREFSKLGFISVGRGEKTSYAYVCSDNDITSPLIQSGIAAPICRDDDIIGIEGSYSRFLIVGDGSLESVVKTAYSLRGTPLGRLSGEVTGDLSTAVWVSAIQNDSDNNLPERVVNQARCDENGKYEMHLPPGTYRIIAHQDGSQRSDEVVTEIAEQDEKTANLALGSQGTLSVQTQFFSRSDMQLEPLPAKLTVIPLGDTQRNLSVLGDFTKAGAATYDVRANGVFLTKLPPGTYRAYVSRGFEFSRYQSDFEILAGQETNIEARLIHQLDTTGLLSAEFHQHSLGSVDADVPLPIKVMENAAEGIEIAVSTDHDNIVDFTPYVKDLGLQEHLLALAGDEVSYQSMGHFNAFPWEIDPADPFRDLGSRLWFGKTLPELFADIRARGNDPLIQLNHPRSAVAGTFLAMRLDPTNATRIPRDPPSLTLLPANVYDEWSPDFEAVEVNGSLGTPSLFTDSGKDELARRAAQDAGTVPVWADYMALLGAGMPVIATGNSDTHGKNGGVGYPRNFLRLDVDSPSQITEADIKAAVRAQRVSVGSGCLAELWVDDRRPMGVNEAVDSTALENLRLRIQAPTHVRLDRVELYINGQSKPLLLEDDTLRIADAGTLSLSLPMEATSGGAWEAAIGNVPTSTDLVILAVARGGQGLSPTGGGQPFCYSAPLYVDQGAPGWRGWLADTQDVASPD